MRKIDLTGKTAVVTGGGQGIGAATVKGLHEAGANLIVNYFADDLGENQAKAESLASSLDRAIAIPADVRHPTEIQTMFDQAIEHFGHVDIVVNNAGVLRDRTTKKMSHEDWQAVIDTNLSGVFNVCKVAVEHLGDEGRIVNLSSVSGAIGIYGQANYSSAKAGVIGLTKVLSRELAKRQITVNAVAPGVVEAGMGLTIPEEHRAEMLKSVPLGRFADPSEIADTILFLCSDLANYVTGQTIHVNGGWWAP